MQTRKFGFGQPVRRVEDARFLRGLGQYTGDIVPSEALRMVVLRSPHPHARFSQPDLARALAMPGVRAILTAADLAHLGDLPCGAPLNGLDGRTMSVPPYPVLARDVVRHVGDAVVAIVADTEVEARDAAEAIDIAYEPLPAVGGLAAALAPDAPLVWPDLGSNLAVETQMGDAGAVAAVFATAAHLARVEIVNNRLVANYMEPRAAIGDHDPAEGRFTLTVGSQGVHGLRDVLAGPVMGVKPELLRVVTPDVGGGFGPKAVAYREYPLVLEAAKRCGQPVAWLCDRSEHFLADAHGRDNLSIAEMALDAQGNFLALRVDIRANMGAYLSQFAPYIPWLGVTMATGPYDIPAFHGRLRCAYTHTPPVDAYRGAGRPEAAYLLERLVDECARIMHMPREEIRARNFITRAQMPYATQTGRTYDVGDFEGAMRRALEKADYASFAQRASEAKARGRLRGIGFASYVECTAWGEGEQGSVSLDPDGGFTVQIGTQSSGQGHATAYAQMVSQQFDIPAERIRVVQGDTSALKSGGGTGGSRSIPIGAVMVVRAGEALAQKVREAAGEKLEVAAADLEFIDGMVRVAGTDRGVSLQELATQFPQSLTGEAGFDPPEATYPNGTHVCEVEVDPHTGEVEIVRYTVCDDFGTVLNPMLLEGQVQGGIAQGVGQALLEEAVFAADGQMVAATFNDYAIPRAADLPRIDFETRNVPSSTNPLGLKGAGEAGSIGAAPAVMNALADALERAGVHACVDMPATAAKVAAALIPAISH